MMLNYWGNVNPIGIRACYDEGKRAAESICFDFKRVKQVDVRVIRIFNTYGPYMRHDDGRVVSNMIWNALNGIDIEIYGDGSQTRSFCYVDDLVAGILKVLFSDNALVSPVNLGNPNESTIFEIAQLVKKLTETTSKITFAPLPQDDPRQRQPDITLAIEMLNWTPEINLQNGIEKLYIILSHCFNYSLLVDLELIMKSALVLGAGGFIGSHMVKRLKTEGYWVRGVDLKYPEYSKTHANEFIIGDLREPVFTENVIALSQNSGSFDEIYQFAADMGGAGFVFTGENDAEIMHNSATINLNVLEYVRRLNDVLLQKKTKIFYSSSACMYPAHNQEDPNNPNCKEDSAYPAAPDSEYGWEKLFSERLFFAFNRNHGIPVAVARYHNIFGPEGTWNGGREKAPAAICRKIAYAKDHDEIEVWGDGTQTRSFLFIDECIEATRRMMMHPNFTGPVNIGSEEMVTINQLVEITAEVAGKSITKKHIPGPLGVRGRNSNNDLIREVLDWDYEQSLQNGIEKTYAWICGQIMASDQ